MHQVVGSIRSKKKQHTFTTKNNHLNANAALESMLDRKSITSLTQDDSPKQSLENIYPHAKRASFIQSPKSHRQSVSASPKRQSSIIASKFQKLYSRKSIAEIDSPKSMADDSDHNGDELNPEFANLSNMLEIRQSSMYSESCKSRSVLQKLGDRIRGHKNRTLTGSWPQIIIDEEDDFCPMITVFHPYSGPRMIWDLAIIFMILYTAIGVPMRLSWSLQETLTIWIFDRLLDLLFMIDILINFNTAFERGTELVVERKHICLNYLRTWFALDFIASFPFDFIISLAEGNKIFDFENQDNSSLSLLPRLVRLFKLSRLFRLARLQRILRRVQLQLGIRNSTNKILKFSGAAVLCAHWMACMFYATSLSTDFGDFPSWVDRLNENGKNQLDSSNVSHTYIASLYWSLTTMTSIGYGDVSPKTPAERMFGIFGMICGAVLFGHFMGNVLAVVADMSPAENEFHLKMDMLNVYMKEQNLKTELRRQIEEFYHIEHKLNNHQVDEAEMLRELPDRLKRELSLAISKRILGNVPLFEGMSPSFVRRVGLSMERRVYPQGEFVINEGEEVNQFYILTAGRAYLMQENMVIGAIANGDYFGSIPIHLGQYQQMTKSTYSVRTLEWTEVRSLSIARFRQLIVEFPEAKDILVRRIVDNILDQNRKSGTSTASETSSQFTDDASKSSKYKIDSINDIEMQSHLSRASSGISFRSSPSRKLSLIDRNQLIRFVEEALCPKDKDRYYRPRRSSLASSVGEVDEIMKCPILKQLTKHQIQMAEMSKDKIKRKITGKFVDFDSLLSLLSLIVSASKEENEDGDEKLLNVIKCIDDQALLPKIVRLRKVMQYFLSGAHIENEDDEKNNIELQIKCGINSFFRSYIFVDTPQSLRKMIRNNSHNQFNNDEEVNQAITHRILYRLPNDQGTDFPQSVELTFERLGYKTTFSQSINLDIVISDNFFDICIIDSDDMTEIDGVLRLLSPTKVRAAISLLFVVSNCMDHARLVQIAKKYGVNVILRKPLIYQDLCELFKSIGLVHV